MSKDKKQMIVMGALVLVIVAVGAFQFMGGSKKKGPVAEADESKLAIEAGSGEEVAAGKDYTPPVLPPGFEFPGLDKRDPFQAQAKILDEPKDDKRPPQWTDPNKGRPTTQITSGRGYDPVPTGPPGSGNTESSRAVGEPPFDVVGIIQGSRSTMAILSPDEGRQQMVSIGDTIGDWTVAAISPNTIEVRYKGKSETLNLRKTSSK